MHATRAAVEEGILPGGGVALLRAVEALKRVKTDNEDQKHGVDIVRKALSSQDAMNGAKIRRLHAGVFYETWTRSGRHVVCIAALQ